MKRWRPYLVGALPVLLAACSDARAPTPEPGPVIDMHLHALPADAQGPPPLAICAGRPAFPPRDPVAPWPEVFIEHSKNPPCDDPVTSPETDDALRDGTLEALEANDVVTAVVSGSPDLVRGWTERAPDRLVPSLLFDASMLGTLSPDTMRRWFEEGRYRVLGEVTLQYGGVRADDPAFEPYLAVAEELDVPVGIHVGTGPPGAPYLGFEGYRARLHSPLALEEMLMRHPDLRLYVMHAGWPMLEDMLAVLYAHPQVYVGTGVLQMALPRAEYHRYLRRLVEAGFGDRIMFGSDQMVWPGLVEEGIRAIMEAPFLTEDQKRAILHDNAARFLRLEDDGAA